MRRRRTAAMGEDTRKVAIYTRKSVITNKGDSIGVQLKQSADYAMSQLKLPEDYEFEQYSDKGLSGYYADRPDFQRMLHDIDSGKIRAVACYKLDRISRKTSDLMRLLEYLEKNDVVAAQGDGRTYPRIMIRSWLPKCSPAPETEQKKETEKNETESAQEMIILIA